MGYHNLHKGLAMEKAIREQVIAIVKSVVGIDIAKYPASTVISTISEWDSFNNLMLIARFQEDLNIEFTAHDVERIQTIGALMDFLDEKTRT
jgi:acyl carrier protein